MIPLLLLLVLLLPAGSMGSTSVTPARASNLQRLHPTPAAAAPITVTGHALVLLAGAQRGTRAGGALLGGALGLAATTTAVAACRVGPCTAAFRGAGTPRLVVGQWAESLTFTFLQPTGGATGFVVEVAVEVGAVWTAHAAFLSTGLTTARTAQTVDVTLWVSLGTTVRPTVVAFDVADAACGAAGRCP